MQKDGDEVTGQPPVTPIGRPPRKVGLVIAGGMILSAGVICIINGLSSLLNGAALVIGPDTGTVDLAVCGFIVLFFGTIAIAGGLTALWGKHISLAIAGAAAGMMGGGDPGFWLGLVSLLLIGLSDVDI